MTASKHWYGLRFRLHPFYFIDRNIVVCGVYEYPLHRFIAKEINSGMTCLDVGANIGAIAMHLGLRVGKSGSVHCFEPVHNNANRLQEHADENSLTNILHVNRFALSNARGVAEMLIARDNIANQGMGSLVDNAAVLTEQITVECRTLVDWASESNINQIDFVKVDIQGAELMFLEGAEEVLLKYRPMLAMEISPACLGEARVGSDELLSKLEGWGYSAWQFRANGRLGAKIQSKHCSPDFRADNVIFKSE